MKIGDKVLIILQDPPHLYLNGVIGRVTKCIRRGVWNIDYKLPDRSSSGVFSESELLVIPKKTTKVQLQALKQLYCQHSQVDNG